MRQVESQSRPRLSRMMERMRQPSRNSSRSPAPRSAPEAVTADWLSSAVYLRGGTLAEKLRRELPGTSFRFTALSGRTSEADEAF